MKTKRIASLLLCLLLALGLLPTAALATPVNKITITMTAPSAGKALPTDAKTSSTGSTQVTKVEWSPADATMQAGTEYTLTLTVEMKPEKDNTFSTGTINTTINGSSSGVKVNRVSGTVVTVTRSYSSGSGSSSTGSSGGSSAVNTVNLTMESPLTTMPPPPTVPESASCEITNVRWTNTNANGKIKDHWYDYTQGGQGMEAITQCHITLRIKNGLDKVFADDASKFNISVNGKTNKIGMVLSISEDRKEIVVMLDYHNKLVPNEVTEGRSVYTYKIGDTLPTTPFTEEKSYVVTETVSNRTIPESPDGTIQPYSWLITEVDVRVKDPDKYLLASVETVRNNLGKVVRYNKFGRLGLVGDIRYETPFRAHITYYQWFGKDGNEKVSNEMLDWLNAHADASAVSNYTVTGTAKLQDFLASRLHSEDKTIQTENGIKYAGSDARAYMWAAPTMAIGKADSSHKAKYMNEKVALLTDPIQVVDEHAERMFSGVLGQWYLVKAKDLYGEMRVGFIPAAYVEGASGTAQPASPSAPSAPATPSTPSTPAAPAAGTAYASTQTVELDGKKVEFQMYALHDANGNPTNYVKVRDLALALNGTKAQFGVEWDGAVNLAAGSPYSPNGSENSTPFKGNRAYSEPTSPTKVNGAASDLSAIVLTDDNGGAYTYYQLRDLGQKLGFNVGWSGERGVYIESDKPYSG